jgi:hypothetical protein
MWDDTSETLQQELCQEWKLVADFLHLNKVYG